MLFKRLFNRGMAIEVICEKMVMECDTIADATFINGLCTMARELGLISQNEYADYTTDAYRKAQAAQKLAEEKRKAIAAERKAERAAKAKAEKELSKRG